MLLEAIGYLLEAGKNRGELLAMLQAGASNNDYTEICLLSTNAYLADLRSRLASLSGSDDDASSKEKNGLRNVIAFQEGAILGIEENRGHNRLGNICVLSLNHMNEWQRAIYESGITTSQLFDVLSAQNNGQA